MAANGDVIKSFLVGLGFDVDESSLAVFNKAIANAALRVTALYTAINAFAGSMVYAFSKISEGFEEMGYQYHIIAPAINKAIVLRQELLKAYSSAGINIRKTIVDSIKLNMSLTKTRFAMEAIYKSVGSRFFGLLQKQSDMFRKRLYENMPYIINVLTKLVSTVFKAFEAVTILGGRLWSILSRVYDFFVMLDTATNGWSTVVLGLVAAWKLLNLSFIATPLGALLTGFVALLTLWDDFKTFKEGGKSFFNWAPVIPIIDALAGAFKSFALVLGDVVRLIGAAVSGGTLSSWDAFKDLASDISDLFKGINISLDLMTGKLSGIGGGAGSIFHDMLDWKGAYNKITGSGNTGGNTFPSSPLGSQPAIAPFNMNAKFQTDISIMGSPNADATGRAVADQQMGVNRDSVRNLKGVHR